MTEIAVVFHSGTGRTARLAEAVSAGVSEVRGARATAYAVTEEIPWPRLAAADAIIFGCPTHMGSASAPFKGFMDASIKPWLAGAWRDKLAAGFVCSANPSGDKLQTLTQLAVFAAQHGMLWIGLDVHADPRGAGDGLNRLGSWLGAMAESDRRAPLEASLPLADLRTAAYLGKRVAAAASRWTRTTEPDTRTHP